MKTCFLADPHLDHERVLEMANRPFLTLDEHNDYMIDATNRVVDRNDRLFVLGDFAWRQEKSFLDRIDCKNIHLIIGNHDRAQGIKKFKSAEIGEEIKLGEHKVYLSHYAHAYWPASHYGSLHLYGHTHFEREETLDAAFPGRRSLDVGVDSAFRWLGAYRPFTDEEVLSILLPRPGHDPIEFYHERDKVRQEERRQWLQQRRIFGHTSGGTKMTPTEVERVLSMGSWVSGDEYAKGGVTRRPTEPSDVVPAMFSNESILPRSVIDRGLEQLKAINEGKPAPRLHSEQKEFGGQTGPHDTGAWGICSVCGSKEKCECKV